MKLFVVTFFCVLAIPALQPVESADSKEVGQRCEGESQVDDAILDQARFKNVFIDDENLKKHLLCFGKGMGFLDETTGEIEMGALKSHIMNEKLGDSEQAEAAMAKCAKNETDEDGNVLPEETAYKLFKCFYETTNKKL